MRGRRSGAGAGLYIDTLSSLYSQTGRETHRGPCHTWHSSEANRPGHPTESNWLLDDLCISYLLIAFVWFPSRQL